MKNRIILGLFICIFLLLLAVATAFYFHQLKQTTPTNPTANEDIEYEKQILTEATHHLRILHNAVEMYLKYPTNADKSYILLAEILKLAETDLSQGEWDNTLGVYTTEHFVYMGGCYSNWCYVEANRKGSSYSLYTKYDMTGSSIKYCATLSTELGHSICKYLKRDGWKYVEGEI